MKRGKSENLKNDRVQGPIGLLCLIGFLTVSTLNTAAQTQQISPRQVSGDIARQVTRLSPDAEQIAGQIGVTPLLKRLEHSHDEPSVDASGRSMESIVVRQEITEYVLAASLDIDSTNAVIDSEIEQIRGIRSDLQARNDKAQNVINIASILTGGVAGAVTSALQFRSSTVKLGNGIGVGGGAGSVLLSIIGIRKQGGGRRTLGDSPRMLARVFGRQPEPTERIPSVYPRVVWSYLNSTAPDQQNIGTRSEQLIAKWRTEGRIQPDGSPKGERKIESISGNIAQVRKLNISDLNDRMSMLLDVRATLSLMKRGLSEILRGLSQAT